MEEGSAFFSQLSLSYPIFFSDGDSMSLTSFILHEDSLPPTLINKPGQLSFWSWLTVPLNSPTLTSSQLLASSFRALHGTSVYTHVCLYLQRAELYFLFGSHMLQVFLACLIFSSTIINATKQQNKLFLPTLHIYHTTAQKCVFNQTYSGYCDC